MKAFVAPTTDVPPKVPELEAAAAGGPGVLSMAGLLLGEAALEHDAAKKAPAHNMTAARRGLRYLTKLTYPFGARSHTCPCSISIRSDERPAARQLTVDQFAPETGSSTLPGPTGRADMDGYRRRYEACAYLRVGNRTTMDALIFLGDLKRRLMNAHIQLTTDGLGAYMRVVNGLWAENIDFAMLHKSYGAWPSDTPERRYKPTSVHPMCESSKATLTPRRSRPVTSSAKTSRCGWHAALHPAHLWLLQVVKIPRKSGHLTKLT